MSYLEVTQVKDVLENHLVSDIIYTSRSLKMHYMGQQDKRCPIWNHLSVFVMDLNVKKMSYMDHNDVL